VDDGDPDGTERDHLLQEGEIDDTAFLCTSTPHAKRVGTSSEAVKNAGSEEYSTSFSVPYQPQERLIALGGGPIPGTGGPDNPDPRAQGSHDVDLPIGSLLPCQHSMLAIEFYTAPPFTFSPDGEEPGVYGTRDCETVAFTQVDGAPIWYLLNPGHGTIEISWHHDLLLPPQENDDYSIQFFADVDADRPYGFDFNVEGLMDCSADEEPSAFPGETSCPLPCDWYGGVPVDSCAGLVDTEFDKPYARCLEAQRQQQPWVGYTCPDDFTCTDDEDLCDPVRDPNNPTYGGHNLCPASCLRNL